MKLSDYWTAYRAGKVNRIHTEPGLHQENLAEHSHGVAMCLILLHPDPHGPLLKAALLHDLGEYKTGDLPSPTKKATPEVSDWCDKVQEEFLSSLGIRYPELHEQDKLALHIADKFDFAMWSYYEWLRGSKLTKVYVERTQQVIYDLEDRCQGPTRTLVGKVNTLLACILQEMRK